MEAKKETKEIISALQPQITAFSAQLLLSHKHGDEVKVGGKVISVFDPRLLGFSSDSFPSLGVMDMGVYLTVDDGLGEIIIVLFESIYENLLIEAEEGSLEGKILLAEGQYAILDKSMDFMTAARRLVRIDSHPSKETKPLVLSYEAKLL